MKSFDLLNEKELIICAHRGVWGGNIPCNSSAAFEIALMQGAHMVELDVTASADGELFVFHPGMEKRLLAKDVNIKKMPAEEVRKLRYVNLDGTETALPVPTLDSIFTQLKGRCYINVDKFWDNPKSIIEMIQKHDVKDQIVVKSPPREDVLQMIEQTAPDVQFLAIISDNHDPFEVHEMLKSRNLNYVGLEVVFSKDSSPLVSREFIDKLHADGKVLWGNSILYDYRVLLAESHSDDTALAGDPDLGWGWFADQGFDIIQTDWPREVTLYFKNRK